MANNLFFPAAEKKCPLALQPLLLFAKTSGRHRGREVFFLQKHAPGTRPVLPTNEISFFPRKTPQDSRYRRAENDIYMGNWILFLASLQYAEEPFDSRSVCRLPDHPPVGRCISTPGRA